MGHFQVIQPIYYARTEYNTVANSEKVPVTLTAETIEWLNKYYPDALNDQERIRMAISDARHIEQEADLLVVEEDSPLSSE